jgi:hypothetical protein
MALINFSAESVEPAASYDVLPKGKYTGMAISSELKPTKSGTGSYLQVVFEIIDGKFKGRKLFSRMNIHNVNKVAEDIGQRELSGLCHAVGVMNLVDSEQLHQIPVTLDVSIEEGKDGYEAQNRIRGFSAAGTEKPTNAAAPAPAAREYATTSTGGAPAPTAGKPVWKK